MDENTRMMIQMATMLMQNQSAIKETQHQLQTTAVHAGKHVTISDRAEDTPEERRSDPINTPSAVLGMDSNIMADLARQIVMNASKGETTRKSNDKPTTIAQMIQSQNVHISTPVSAATSVNNTSEGKIFVYNTIPDDEDENLSCLETTASSSIDIKPDIASLAACTNGHYVTSGGGKRYPSIGPIRNKYGRVLRPGIDNFGRFEAVANHGLIMHAMELLRQKDKKKRGPKEKDTFCVFMYCLPDKNAKLPKFSSLDPIERALVDQHQLEGYGYPGIDYINGIPRKTQLCLSYDEPRFRTHMATLYPRLEGRMWDMYRIDKTRRLIRVDARSPRQLKNMKYQGSLIVIPYEGLDDRPAPIIHRNFDDVYTGNGNTCLSLGNPLSLMQNFNIPLPSLHGVRTDVTVGYRIKSDVKTSPPLSSASSSPGNTNKPVKNGHDSVATTASGSGTTGILFDGLRLMKMAMLARSKLKSTKKIQIKSESILSDMLNAYREDEVLETHRIVVCFQDDLTMEIPTGSVFVMFWNEAFRKHFTGNHHLVPVLDPSAGEDLFQIFGRVLVHGLVQENYVPLRFSPACLAFVLANACSDQLSISSFYQVMSKTEREILLAALAEAKLNLHNLSPRIDRSLKTVLASYGCKRTPYSYELDSHVPGIARSFLLHQPYWALCQIQEVFCQSDMNISGLLEDDIITLYKVLSPDVTSLLHRTVYIYSTDGDSRKSEERVKDMFEEYLHKISLCDLSKLLQYWCGYDCLCVSEFSVKFMNDRPAKSAFEPRLSTLLLPSACTSVSELSAYLDSQMSSANVSETGSNWEYTF
ncbi:uncharacterized protein LOC127853073 isoform X2 [Dreissena polymorpha]|nr:uncharacterized protein LOC127853073 isoform X2 [Dreissena polymorpha]XP_052243160.1 uncharacterized protein LOC127853073 isoform X2 [Dreissena polymorpha]XP_052243162.1 uncharacterized protein LOC127853073 isoform X2 [Dreissena polymorpha]XP_052243163.1 uncharacterized protein LOC127853073 isoform X2 [Dreissena polymorpha]XP_052243164.1 uncharacterized protein LOC127853073 isoform X2 [Dreissena polymorpha]XP_052243165.1 uncharacterized protein LOC127853073 isoform X2 [Dreissena polymorpha]